MKQAKTLNETELKRLLAFIDAGKHAPRNRCAVMLSFLAGMRVGEIARLLVSDVFTDTGAVRDQIVLKASYTKTKETRVIFIGKSVDFR